MAYWMDTWRFPNSIEYEYKFAGNYGAKGEKREKRQKVTPEQIKKQNQYNREKKVRRLIKENFFPDDLWITLKYAKGTKKPLEEVKKDLKNFTDKMRSEYKKRGQPFKFISRVEIGKYGGIHTHILINRLEGNSGTDIIARKSWGGKMFYENIYEAGGYKKLANYIVKEPDEEAEKQISLFPEEKRKEFSKYSTSRNLIRPEPERKTYERRTLRRLFGCELKPTPGYYIDQESVHRGKNKYTGMSYLYYTECRIRTVESREEWRKMQEEGGNHGG